MLGRVVERDSANAVFRSLYEQSAGCEPGAFREQKKQFRMSTPYPKRINTSIQSTDLHVELSVYLTHG